jgi:hypothetical protein
MRGAGGEGVLGAGHARICVAAGREVKCIFRPTRLRHASVAANVMENAARGDLPDLPGTST